MKKTLFIFLFLLGLIRQSVAQDTLAPVRIAIFAPIYLDSAFNDTNGYRYAKNVFPKFISPGLEFYEGAQLALDSMEKEYMPLEVFVYDTRSATTSLSSQLDKAARDGVGLILAHCSSQEITTFAEAGQRYRIPVINVNMPNDGGVTDNPYYVILNPTLRAQCEGIYKYVQKYYSINPIVVFRKKGQLEDRIKSYFEDMAKNTRALPLKMKWVELTDSFSVNQLRTYLDTTNETLCIAGSLDENFGKRLVQQLAALNKQHYSSTVIGMPTWDAIPFNKPEYKGITIIYSNPFYNAKLDRVSNSINGYFSRNILARPSDMVYRGYEVTWKFGKLLSQYKSDIASNLSSKQFRLFTDFDIQPVIGKGNTLDYFENKKLYFLKWEDSLLRSVY
jgi:hypothetical protein